MTGFELFDYETIQVVSEYPLLKTEIHPNGNIHLTGLIELKDDMDNLIEVYNIDVYPTNKYPYRYPFVFEIGGKVPRNINWHVFEDSGNCCLGSIPEEISRCSKGITLLWFLNEIVVPYFYAQTFRRENGYFLNERPHGIDGDIDFYYEVLKTRDLKKNLQYLEYIKTNPKPERTSSCFCGSGEKYRKCHKLAYTAFAEIRDYEINMLIRRIITSERFKQQHPFDYLSYFMGTLK